MTYLQNVNSILRKLREDEVTAVSDNQLSALVGDFINIVKGEVEDAWNWNVLRDTIQITTSATVFRYVLTNTRYGAKLLTAWNDTQDWKLRQRNADWLTYALNSSNPQSDSVEAYGINGSDGNGDMYVDLYPIPNAAEVLNFDIVLHQADLSSDADVMLVPANVVELGAWALAISERGEDGGVSFNEADARYRQALGDAIAMDVSNQHESETTWIVV